MNHHDDDALTIDEATLEQIAGSWPPAGIDYHRAQNLTLGSDAHHWLCSNFGLVAAEGQQVITALIACRRLRPNRGKLFRTRHDAGGKSQRRKKTAS